MKADEDLATLVDLARKLMDKRYVRGKHHVGAIVRTRSGRMYPGIHVEAGNGRVSLCAEAVAIGAAATAGDTAIDLVVAVTESGDVIPPCGMCRELISDYGIDAGVILEEDGRLNVIPVIELLPAKYVSSRFPNRRDPGPD